MNFEFFNLQGCTDAQNIKSIYRDLIKKHHPDVGGSDDAMKKINAEFDFLMKQGLESVKNSADINEKRTWQDYKQFADILQKIIFLQGVKIEIIGSWVWLSGNTYAHYSTISGAGFKFSKSKKSWYWYSGIETQQYKCRGRYSMNELRLRHGVVSVEGETQRMLQTA